MFLGMLGDVVPWPKATIYWVNNWHDLLQVIEPSIKGGETIATLDIKISLQAVFSRWLLSSIFIFLWNWKIIAQSQDKNTIPVGYLFCSLKSLVKKVWSNLFLFLFRYKITPACDIDFGPLVYGTDKTQNFTIENNGLFPIHFTLSRIISELGNQARPG